mmetsp:Transcript_29283/g.97337  ORF Transcript_29283/g.97337 Transcript_29283/m.97337 type:complete len:411 (-) Transcript_29283:748-1980(-)
MSGRCFCKKMSSGTLLSALMKLFERGSNAASKSLLLPLLKKAALFGDAFFGDAFFGDTRLGDRERSLLADADIPPFLGFGSSSGPSWARRLRTSTSTLVKPPTFRSRAASRSTSPVGKTLSHSPASNRTGASRFTLGRPAAMSGSRLRGVCGAVGTWQTEPIQPPRRSGERRNLSIDWPPPCDIPISTMRSLSPFRRAASWSTKRSKSMSVRSMESMSKMSTQEEPPHPSSAESGYSCQDTPSAKTKTTRKVPLKPGGAKYCSQPSHGVWTLRQCKQIRVAAWPGSLGAMKGTALSKSSRARRGIRTTSTPEVASSCTPGTGSNGWYEVLPIMLPRQCAQSHSSSSSSSSPPSSSSPSSPSSPSPVSSMSSKAESNSAAFESSTWSRVLRRRMTTSRLALLFNSLSFTKV